MPAAIGIVGTAYSIYDGIQKAKQEKNAQNQAQGDFDSNQAFARQRYQDWYKTFFPVAQQRIAELTNKGLTPESATSLGNLQASIGKQERNLDTSAAAGRLSSGAANGAYQDLALRGATGSASIALNDQAQKNSQLGQWYQMGLSEPTSSYLVQGSNRDAAGYADQQAQRYGQDANSDWAAVSKGMMSIADSMAARNQASTPNVNTSIGGQLPNVQDQNMMQAPIMPMQPNMTQTENYNPNPMAMPMQPMNQGLGNLGAMMGTTGSGGGGVGSGLTTDIQRQAS